MKKTLLPVAAVALLALAACENKPETVDMTAPDPMAEQLKNAPKAELPPPVEKTVSFRCQPGNVLRFVDFFQGGKMVNYRAEKDAMPVQLKAPEAGQPFTNGTVTVTGTAASITVEEAGAKLTCKA